MYANHYWELTAKLVNNEITFEMKNRLPQTQPANVTFQVTFEAPAKDDQDNMAKQMNYKETFYNPPGTVWFGPGYDGAEDNFSVIRFIVPAGAGGLGQLADAGPGPRDDCGD